MDYSYYVEHNKNYCQGMKNKRCKWAKGKSLGGSSSINAMLYVRGNDRDYDDWSRMGNKGWSYEEVLPYFKKSANCAPEYIAKWGAKHCDTDGPLSVRFVNYSFSDIPEVIQAGARELNIPELEPMIGDKYVGYGNALCTIDNGRRVSVAKAFLSPIKDRENLYVLKSATVDKILINGGRATGIRVTLQNSKTIEIKAFKEVILSAGSIASPQLLMLSGIGPKEHLDDMGIKVVADLPVGKNLQDHVMWQGILWDYNSNRNLPSLISLINTAYEYLRYGKGAFATIAGANFFGFLNVTDVQSAYPDIQFYHIHLPQWELFRILYLLNNQKMKDEHYSLLTALIKESDVTIVIPSLLKPKSVGEIKLASTNPADKVKIYPNYFSRQEDVDTMMKALDYVKLLGGTKAFKERGIKLVHYDIPYCRHTQPDSREYWKCNLRQMSATNYHPTGTAKMGPVGDPTAVVDPRLRVHGVQRLRVIDASIMPDIVSGNTNGPTVMIAEKGADLIKQDWSVRDEF